MRYQRNLSIDRQFNQVRQRDRIIRQLWMLALILLAIILVLAMMLLIATKAQALECRRSPQSGTYWSWRQIAGRKCWYQGRHVMPKSQLHWRVPAENKPLIIDEIKNHRAEASSVDANGSDLIPYDEIMEKPQPTDECCWPPLDERSFKSRWDEIPVGWRQ